MLLVHSYAHKIKTADFVLHNEVTDLDEIKYRYKCQHM